MLRKPISRFSKILSKDQGRSRLVEYLLSLTRCHGLNDKLVYPKWKFEFCGVSCAAETAEAATSVMRFGLSPVQRVSATACFAHSSYNQSMPPGFEYIDRGGRGFKLGSGSLAR